MSALGKVVMVQGTSSHAGKSVLAAALCRIFARAGYQVAPFKAQNMSLNSFVTPDGGEIGRSQAVQAAAAMVEPRVEMNPVLLKPEAESRSQVVVLGRPQPARSAREYYELKQQLWPRVTESLDSLRREFDVVVIEGAGSPAEINLKQHDIVNMRVARHADAPVLLIADIERGGVFAQIVGTMTLLEPEERALVAGHVINKFRGDPTLLTDSIDLFEEHTGVPAIGVLPYFTDIQIPEEDSLGIEAAARSDAETVVDVAVIRVPQIANFDDFDPLRNEPGVRVRYVRSLSEFGRPHLIILPGSKTTVHDLQWLRSTGLAERIINARRDGTPLIGICAGFQMLGRELFDPLAIEASTASTLGLGLLPQETTFHPQKVTNQVTARVSDARGLLSGCVDAELTAYEIHMGVSAESGGPITLLTRSGRPVAGTDGALDAEGLTFGTYLHGLFHNRELRRSILECAAERQGRTLPAAQAEVDPDAEYDKLADFVEAHMDVDHVRRAMELPV